MAQGIEYFKTFLPEMSRLRQSQYTKADGLQLEKIPQSGELSNEYVSSIELWSDNARIMLKAYFDIGTASAWAARGLDLEEADLDDSLAMDFFREFSNLQGGILRGIFESNGLSLAMSLPLVVSGETDAIFARGDGSAETITWRLSDGSREVVCSAEVELADKTALDQIKPALEAYLKNELEKSSSGNTGDVEFFL